MKRLLCALGLLVCALGAMAQPSPARLSAPPPGIATAAAPPGCDCGPGHWWDPNRKSCVTGACEVPNMPDGDKGGGYFAWHGTLFINTPCLPPPCKPLDKTTATGQPGWMLVSGPGVTSPKPAVVVSTYSGWGTVPGASWVSVDANRGSQPGDYVYEYKFCLCARLSPQTVGKTTLTLKFLADNAATVYLNSTTILPTTPGNKNFLAPPRSVTYTGGSAWVPGTNTIKIVVHNETSVTGLAASLSLTSDLGCPAVP